ncbi:MAG: ribonuclease HII [Deltaproteobacteria bacterium]|nr:ribonuclease HII [Deltaproteobacteria bacterium]
MTKSSSYPTYDYEARLIENRKIFCIAGIDEAGRGPGAGPVVAGAVHIPKDCIKSLAGRLRDSKKMTEKQRAHMYGIIAVKCPFGVGIVDNHIIDAINILQATKKAMAGALAALQERLGSKHQVDYVLIDGNMRMENIKPPCESIVRGDNKSLSIAAGAVIAKVTRDRIMGRLHEEYPQYGWNRNKGYLSQKHMQAIRDFGTTPYHRMSYRRVGR